MQTILRDIQETVVQYARIISLGMDVEVVDNRFVGVAGTGVFCLLPDFEGILVFNQGREV